MPTALSSTHAMLQVQAALPPGPASVAAPEPPPGHPPRWSGEFLGPTATQIHLGSSTSPLAAASPACVSGESLLVFLHSSAASPHLTISVPDTGGYQNSALLAPFASEGESRRPGRRARAEHLPGRPLFCRTNTSTPGP